MKPFVRLSVCLLLAVAPRLAAAQTAPAPDAAPPTNPTGAEPAATSPAPDSGPPKSATDAPTAAPGPAPAPVPAAPAAAPSPTTAKGVEWTSLKLLKAKGVISEAEYLSALKDMGEVVGAADANTLVVSKVKLTLYGFTQADFTYDSTQSCNEFCSNAAIQRPGSYRGDHARMVFSPRDSRFGVRIAVAEEHSIKASGLLETDFFGPTTTTEAGTWVNPVLRVRHAYLKLETPIVDVLIGQTWSLFGWGAAYLMTSAQEPGLPGQLFQRTPQIRITKAIKTGAGVTFELAAAMNRPPQMDSGVPEGVAGLRILLDKLTGYHTVYLSANVTQPASIAITGDLRGFRIAEFSAAPKTDHWRTGGGFAVDAFIPIIPATKTNHDNALSVSGELAVGQGTSDMYTGMGAAGTVNPAIPPAMVGGTPGTYTPNFDAGFAAYAATGKLELIKWTSYMVGAEFYPGAADGRLGLFGNYGHTESPNSKDFAGPNARKSEDFFDAGLFFDPTKQTRLGADYGFYKDHYVTGRNGINHSVMTSAWLFF